MNIHAIHIYGYGKFANQIFRLSPSGLHLIYGLNEAGKTTLMSFIESMLFGFPKTKRYVPKTGGIYGGMLEARHPELGHIRIERIAGKPERVTVYLEDGSTRPEAFLKQLLSGIDRRLYKAVYSFDVFGLQEIHQFSRDQMDKFLLFSSLFGSDAVSKMDEALRKRQEELFKPNGRKPELNQELEHLKKLSEDLKKAKAREGDYQQIVNGKKAAEASIKENERLLKDLMHSIAQIEQAIEIHPLKEEERRLAAELEADGAAESGFPEGGLFELEKYESHLHPKAAQLKALQEKKRDLKQQAAALAPHEGYLRHEAKIEELLSEHPFYQSYTETIMTLTDKLKQTNERVQAGMKRLKIDHEADILKADTTYEYEWKLEETVQTFLRLREEKRTLDERFEQARINLEEAEQACSDVEGEVMPDDIRKQKEEALSRLTAAGGGALKREELLRQLSFLKREQNERMKKRKTAAAAALTAAIAAGAAAVFFKAWLPAALIIPLSLVLILFALKKPEPSSVMAFMEKQLEDAERGAAENGPELKRLREALWRDDQNRQLLMAKQSELKQKEAEYERAIQKFEEWEKDFFPYQEQIDRYLKELNLGIDPSFLSDAYALMKELSTRISEKREMEDELRSLKAKKASFEERLRRLATSLLQSEGSVQELMFKLKHELDSQKEKLLKKQEAELSIQHTDEQIKELSEEAEYFKSQITALFQKAGANGRDRFIELAKRDEFKKAVKLELSRIKAEISKKDERAVMLASAHSLADLKEKLEGANEQRNRTEIQLKEEREKAAMLLAEQRRLEESGTVSELTHLVEMQKARVTELAKNWASVKLVRQAVKNRIEDHKKVRLPKLLHTAESLLKPLTDGRYENIYFSETDDAMMVMRKDRAVFYAHELSQATCEQLYLAIRFALALSQQKRINLPFLLDDSFVHFDRKRFKQVLDILKRLSGEEQQILYFTCHEHVREAFREGEVTMLSPSLHQMEK
ncbi:AAA family ATPase [Bacillus sp. HSf4]|uniref:ATP-binding protein n=1 Tax=Bacillus sp. HSf4 TaxID=3035514 RepID=UPI002409AB2F|nr:AAA family ATPase [Bacillus sp. HSf4]WFA06273.1 AAA family ATPase [Bacillus sp. HSf4]